MYAHYNQGSIAMRELTADDVTGICTIYAPDGSRMVAQSVASTSKVAADSCDPTPRHGFGTQCASPPKKGACSISAVGPRPSPRSGADAAFLTPAALVALAFASRRFSRRLRARRKAVTT
jgi:hypothetical protein